MNRRVCTMAAVAALSLVPSLHRNRQDLRAQAPASTATAAPHDPVLEAAGEWIGRALFVRGGYAGGELTYDADGHVNGAPRQVDWTLAGINIEAAGRRNGRPGGAGDLQLDGVRVAVRYNPEAHVFERHPLKDQKMRIVIAVNEAGRGLQGALGTIFAVGIDPGLQRAMPLYWRHYFSATLAWPTDPVTGEPVIASNAPAAGVEFPVLQKKLEPDFTPEARQDRVKGVVQVKLTVGTDGLPYRVFLRQPLGYGLDERTVETVERYRFRPGMKDGKAIAVEMLINQAFDVAARPGP